MLVLLPSNLALIKLVKLDKR